MSSRWTSSVKQALTSMTGELWLLEKGASQGCLPLVYDTISNHVFVVVQSVFSCFGEVFGFKAIESPGATPPLTPLPDGTRFFTFDLFAKLI